VYHDGTWGTVCDDGFTDTAATIVCRSLELRYVYIRKSLTIRPPDDTQKAFVLHLFYIYIFKHQTNPGQACAG